MLDKRKVVIIGAAHVGSHVAMALCFQGICDEIAFIGDRLATDIAIGASHGIPSVLVLSGVTTREEYENSDIKASVVVDSMKDLAKYL